VNLCRLLGRRLLGFALPSPEAAASVQLQCMCFLYRLLSHDLK